MRVSKKAEYGLIAMVHLAKNKNKRPISIREISNNEKVPFEFLSKIFAGLEKANLVVAKHGASGGYLLANPSKKITVLDIIKPLENMKKNDCAFCSRKTKCPSKNVWDKLNGELIKTLKNITLAELIK